MKSTASRYALPAAAALATAVALGLGLYAARHQSAVGPILLAPMIGLEPCISLTGDTLASSPDLQMQLMAACLGPQASAGRVVEDTLSALETPGHRSSRHELGYTLHVPLLRLYRREGERWVIDADKVGRIARTVRDNRRPLVLYLFSTHFAQHAPIEKELAADPANLAWTRDGPLAHSTYYGDPLYNWTFARTDTPLTQRRVEAARAVLDAVCALGPEHAAKLRGVTLLGELHHLFPDFEAGMGFEKPYRVTDYSEASRQAFRAWLRQRFGTIGALNKALGSHWASFDDIEPPAKDIRQEPLRDYTEHIDAYAHGRLPITGWAWRPGLAEGAATHVRIYRNGELAGRVPVAMGRQDVLAAVPSVGTANTGWRFDLDFRELPTGLHRIDVLLEDGQGGLVQLASRQVAIMDRRQATPQPMQMTALPASRPMAGRDGEPRGDVDVPRDQSSFFYNPMAPLWHAFRGQQVVDYLRHFSAAVRTPCLGQVPHYTHQIIPFTNPGWDETRFAIEASLQPIAGLDLGISLYGEPTYGSSFLDWLGRGRGGPTSRYGITEFHPLRALDAVELRATLDRHAVRGMDFVSFFLEPRWAGQRISDRANLFSFDPANPEYGSDHLYAAVRTMLTGGRESQPAARPAAPAPGLSPVPARSTP